MEVKVPDIGDFEDIPVIEVLVAAGDEVQAEDPLITLESDKATMEVPSPAAGKVADITIKVGDKVSEGSVLLTLETAEAASPNGLVVPVIKDADAKGIIEVAKDLTELSGKARAGKLSGGDMQGSTFTISSLGGIGGTGFTPIVNAPEVAILGVTRSAMKPVWDGSQFVPRLMVPLSLSYDHRVIDGALAARFVAHLVNQLSDLRRVLL